jgi:nucleotide-binding universal stress UspA family protein
VKRTRDDPAPGEHPGGRRARDGTLRYILAPMANALEGRDNHSQASMVRPIICGVDDSDVAREAVRVARDLSDRFGSRLVLVHVAPGDIPPGTSTVPHGRSELLERERRDAELLLAEQAVATRLGSRVQRRALFGDAAETLVELARTERADLVVLGSRGGGPVSSALLGSVSTAVAGTAPCPVVIVPAGVTRPNAARNRGSNGNGAGR